MQKTTSTTLSRLIASSLGLLSSLVSICATADVIAGTGTPTTTTVGARTATQLVGTSAGFGHMLVMPYFNTQDGNVSIFSVTNGDSTNGKVVKIRLRGASNGDPLLSLTLLLAPGDVWNAILSQGADGITQLMTADKSCTVPRLVRGAAYSVSTSRLSNPTWTAADKATHSREGYLEVINMADIPDRNLSSALFSTVALASCDDAVIAAAVVNTNHTSEATAAAQGLAAPTGGLGGKWIIMNAPETTSFVGTMYAIRAVDAVGANARGNFILFPQTGDQYPGNVDDVTVDPLLRNVAYAIKWQDGGAFNATSGPAIATAFHLLPDLSTPYASAPGASAASLQAASISKAMSASRVGNELATDNSLGAKTDWVFSFPTRQLSIAIDYAAAGGPRVLHSLVPPSGYQYFSDNNVFRFQGKPAQLCTYFARQNFRNRDGGLTSPPHEPSPRPLWNVCGNVSVTSFGDAGRSALGGSVTRNNYDLLIDGWGSLDTIDNPNVPGNPVLGHAFIKFVNSEARPGISGNYGITFEHWFTR